MRTSALRQAASMRPLENSSIRKATLTEQSMTPRSIWLK